MLVWILLTDGIPAGFAVCTQLLVSALPAEESVSQFVALLDRCLAHEAFTQRQRRRIASWKEQVHRIWTNLPAAMINGPERNGRSSSGSGKNPGESRNFGRRWSNVAHYPGFYNASSEVSVGTNNTNGSLPFGAGNFQQGPANAYSLFPPRNQQGGRVSPCPSPSARPAQQTFGQQTHNSYGQHTHLSAGKRLFATPNGRAGFFQIRFDRDRIEPAWIVTAEPSAPSECASLPPGWIPPAPPAPEQLLRERPVRPSPSVPLRRLRILGSFQSLQPSPATAASPVVLQSIARDFREQVDDDDDFLQQQRRRDGDGPEPPAGVPLPQHDGARPGRCQRQLGTRPSAFVVCVVCVICSRTGSIWPW